ncbi:hypothetical protein HRbin02_00629 [Candidatus Calditenuaceae archaeon HR02]|nr:hypothetical protein HRbin02_00629 [Candidatus Calditenuaceae archaeon HR02]
MPQMQHKTLETSQQDKGLKREYGLMRSEASTIRVVLGLEPVSERPCSEGEAGDTCRIDERFGDRLIPHHGSAHTFFYPEGLLPGLY